MDHANNVRPSRHIFPKVSERIAGIDVTNPDRVIYPNHNFTKRDLVHYYASIAAFMLPHLKNRPVTLKRYTDTTTGPFFYEKDAPAFTPAWVKTAPVWRRSGESQIRYIVISDQRTLLWTASIGTIEIHPFLALASEIEAPTSIVFDLDPGEGANTLLCARAALLLHDLLDQLRLQSFAKMSGSKGIQVYVPLNTPVTYTVTQPFAKTVAELLHQQHPELIVADMQRVERKNRVFIDWSQNADYKTTVGVYSLRAKRHRPFASLPVTWDELRSALDADDTSSLYWLAPAALDRVQRVGDLFAPVLTLQQSVPEAFVRAAPPHISSSRGVQRSSVVLPPSSRAKARSGEVEEPRASSRGATLPRASAQGGRRRFLLRATNSRITELALETGDTWTCWSLPQRIPTLGATSAVQSATCIATREFDSLLRTISLKRLPARVLDLGTYEIVEGDLARGYAHFFFTGRKLKGDLLLARAPGSTNTTAWLVTRAIESIPYPPAPIRTRKAA